MTPNGKSQTSDGTSVKATRPAPAARTRGATRTADASVPIVASDERRATSADTHANHPHDPHAHTPAPRESLTEQRLAHIPGEAGVEVYPYRDDVEPRGPMNSASVHQTESKVPHPLGKTRSGVAQRRGR